MELELFDQPNRKVSIQVSKVIILRVKLSDDIDAEEAAGIAEALKDVIYDSEAEDLEDVFYTIEDENGKEI